MKENGKMIYSMAKVKKLGPMVLSTKASISKVRSTDLVSTAGMTVHVMRVNGMKIRSEVWAPTLG